MKTQTFSALWSHCFTALCVLGGLLALTNGLWAAGVVLLGGCAAHALTAHLSHRHIGPHA